MNHARFDVFEGYVLKDNLIVVWQNEKRLNSYEQRKLALRIFRER